MGHILIIDDDPQVLKTLSKVVESFGHQVSAVADGSEGLRRFGREHHDCVITDLAMPGVDGLSVLEAVKQASPATGVLVITGHSTVDLVAASVNMGADAYLTKPFKIGELDRHLQQLTVADVAERTAGAAASSPWVRNLALWTALLASLLAAASYLVDRL